MLTFLLSTCCCELQCILLTFLFIICILRVRSLGRSNINIVIDFDIYQGTSEQSSEIFNRFKDNSLDGIFSGSTCGGYGMIVKIDDKKLRHKLIYGYSVNVLHICNNDIEIFGVGLAPHFSIVPPSPYLVTSMIII